MRMPPKRVHAKPKPKAKAKATPKSKPKIKRTPTPGPTRKPARKPTTTPKPKTAVAKARPKPKPKPKPKPTMAGTNLSARALISMLKPPTLEEEVLTIISAAQPRPWSKRITRVSVREFLAVGRRRGLMDASTEASVKKWLRKVHAASNFAVINYSNREGYDFTNVVTAGSRVHARRPGSDPAVMAVAQVGRRIHKAKVTANCTRAAYLTLYLLDSVY